MAIGKETDVVDGPSPSGDVGEELPSDSPDVTEGVTSGSAADETTVPDRPTQNIKAEFDRKLSRVERQLAEMYSLVMAQMARPAGDSRAGTPETSPREYTDTELLDAAQSGSREAMAAYVERQVQRQTANIRRVDAEQNATLTQLRVLYQKYPMLTNATHPLTQAVLQAKAVLISSGAPNSHTTDLEAIKLAIVDNPGLAASSETAASPGGSRTVPAGRQHALEGAAPRRAAPISPVEKAQVSPAAKAVAARMGVRDPAGAIKRFEERNQRGMSGLSPNVIAIVKDQEE